MPALIRPDSFVLRFSRVAPWRLLRPSGKQAIPKAGKYLFRQMLSVSSFCVYFAKQSTF